MAQSAQDAVPACGWLALPGWNPNWQLFFVYWVAAGAVWLGGQRSDAIARLGGLAIPLIDMPAVTLLNWKALSAANSGFVYGSNTALLILLTIGSTAALDCLEVVFAGGMAIVLETLLGLSIGPIAPCGEGRTITVLFSDLRDFTAFAERLPGADVVAFLNAYHERMVATIFAFGGTLDKFLGDGMMVYFGAPVAQQDHAARAVHCALAMQAEMARWNTERAQRGDVSLVMGIGIHTGTVIVGSIGTPARREYTVIGDTVNVAARIQELTREKTTAILISDATRRSAGRAIRTEPVGLERLRGRAQLIEIHRVLPSELPSVRGNHGGGAAASL